MATRVPESLTKICTLAPSATVPQAGRYWALVRAAETLPDDWKSLFISWKAKMVAETDNFEAIMTHAAPDPHLGSLITALLVRLGVTEIRTG